MRVRAMRLRALLLMGVSGGLSVVSLLTTCCSSKLISELSAFGFFSKIASATLAHTNSTLRNKPVTDMVVYYINLRTRPDRRISVTEQLSFLKVPFSMVEAVDVRNNETALLNCWDQNDLQRCAGKIGCKESHLKILDSHARDDSLKTVVIFEDDIVWLNHVDAGKIPEVFKGFEFLFPDWKVLGLSMNVIQQIPTNLTVHLSRGSSQETRVMKIGEAQTTHGYAVRASYIPVLLAVWRKCDVTEGLHVAIDQCWKSLQAQGGWYAFSPQLGIQKPGYSDIENTEVEYNIS
jgi:GR25 family glycosyltransferase involved in LPS biosynthesis